jgi:hypothetical protein
MGWKATPLDVGKLLRFVGLVALILVVSIWLALRFPPFAVRRSEIVRLDIEPYPEGPPLAVFQRTRTEPGALPIDRVEDYIPLPSQPRAAKEAAVLAEVS